MLLALNDFLNSFFDYFYIWQVDCISLKVTHGPIPRTCVLDYMAKGIKDADGIHVANQLTLKSGCLGSQWWAQCNHQGPENRNEKK